jgi:hypothetical protein
LNNIIYVCTYVKGEESHKRLALFLIGGLTKGDH